MSIHSGQQPMVNAGAHSEEAHPEPPLPEALLAMIYEHHQDSVAPAVCKACPSRCCKQGGFALLENVLLIYEKHYQAGRLFRPDYIFEEGLPFSAFVLRYFDVHYFPHAEAPEIVLFHTRPLTEDNRLIKEDHQGYAQRSPNDHPAPESYIPDGCVFLTGKLFHDEGTAEPAPQCLLHSPNINTHLTAKPINCVFHVCKFAGEMKFPRAPLAAKWIKGLAENYPDSAKRFRTLMEKEIKG